MSYIEKVYTGVVTAKPKVSKNKHSTTVSFLMVTDHYILDRSGVCGEEKKEYCVVLLGSDLSEVKHILDVGSVVQVHAVSFSINETEEEILRDYADDYIVATHIRAEKGNFLRDA